MKFNFKSRRFVAGALSLVLLGFGFSNPAVVGLGAEVVCAAVKCDA